MNDLDKKIDKSIRLLRAYGCRHELTIAYSGGKDSDVLLHLAKMAGVQFTVVHNVTTIDPPGTISHCVKAGAIINRPKMTFFDLIAKKGLPSMFRRFCCSYLKEQYVGKYVALGIRRCESVKRAARYDEPTACRVYPGGKESEQVFPILEWTDEDVAQFVSDEHLQCHPLYYVDGHFDVTQRLGCLGCPLQSDRGRGDFLKYPKLLRQYVKAYQRYVSTHKAVNGVYEDIVFQLFYSNHGERKFEQTFHGLFAPPNAKEMLQDYFHIDLT